MKDCVGKQSPFFKTSPFLVKTANHFLMLSSVAHNVIKASDNLEKSLYLQEMRRWKKKTILRTCDVQFADSTALKTDRMFEWKSLHGLRSTSENHHQ